MIVFILVVCFLLLVSLVTYKSLQRKYQGVWPAWLSFLPAQPSPYVINGDPAGYVQPMDWIAVAYPKQVVQTGTSAGGIPMHGTSEGRVESPRKTPYRGRMPSFHLHYYPPNLDKRGGPDHWLSVMDGNPRNDPPGHVPLHFIQLGEMKIYEISQSDAAMLNVGPRGQRHIKGKAFPSGKPVELRIKMGVPGGQFPAAPIKPDGEHGRADWKAEDAMRAGGKVVD